MIKDKFDYLRKLRIKPKKIFQLPSLLALSKNSIQKKYDDLLKFGITPLKITSYPGLLTRDFNSLRFLHKLCKNH